MEIGQVLRSSTDGFTCGMRSQEVHGPAYGAFVRTESRQNGDSTTIIGVITAIRVDDDPLVRQLIMANNGNTYAAAIRDQRENRMVPIEIDVLNVGFANGSGIVFHNLPPRPPFSLDRVVMCMDEEVYTFTRDISFLRLLLNARGVSNPAELVSAVINNAASVRSEMERNDFLITIGRQLAIWLNYDLKTLHHILSLMRPLAV